MADKICPLAEGISTLGTNVRLLPRVDFLMPCEVGKLAKAFPTLDTKVGPFACVNVQVFCQI